MEGFTIQITRNLVMCYLPWYFPIVTGIVLLLSLTVVITYFVTSHPFCHFPPFHHHCSCHHSHRCHHCHCCHRCHHFNCFFFTRPYTSAGQFTTGQFNRGKSSADRYLLLFVSYSQGHTQLVMFQEEGQLANILAIFSEYSTRSFKIGFDFHLHINIAKTEGFLKYVCY